MTGMFPSDPAAVSATLTLPLPTGNHTIYVHGLDGALPTANWGSFSTVTYTLDAVGPTTTVPCLTPSPNGR